MADLHQCKDIYSLKEFPKYNYERAILECIECVDGRLWCDYGEYSVRINYCPFCGYKAKAQVDWEGGEK